MIGTPEDILDRAGEVIRLNGAADAAAGSEQDRASDLGEWDAGDDTAPPPPRGWLLGNTFCRRFVSSLLAGGGVGKSSVRMAQLLALATGRPLTGEHVFQRCRVLIVSLEDDADELRRRIRAAMLHHGISSDEVRGRLFLAAPGAKGWKLAVAQEGGAPARGELADLIAAAIRKHRVDVVSIDPMVKAHGVGENENGAIDFVANILATLAIEHDCAIDAPHHVKKGETEAGNADAGRGASAFKDAARLVYTLKPMSDDEAKTFGVGEDERRRLIRMDSGKVNIAPASAARWFRLVGVSLGNGTALYPKGDEVQTVETWAPPDLWESINTVTANAILDEIDAGLPEGARFSDHHRAEGREAHVVVQKHVDGLNDLRARKIIKTWISTGLLYRESYHDKEARKDRSGLFVNATKRPGR
jgi:hypothetical protein